MKKFLIVMSALSITACGGGGSTSSGNLNTGGEKSSLSALSSSSSTSSLTPKTYSLQKLNSTALGAVYTAQLTGVDSDGVKYTGSVSLENRAEKVLNGVLVTPREYLLSYKSVGSSVAETSIGTNYIDTATGNLISLLANGVTCTSISPYHMPASVKIGDFGVSSVLTCSNKNTQEGNWRAEDAGSGNVRIVFNDTVKDYLGKEFSIEEDSYTLDSNGNITALKVAVTWVSSGYTMVLSNNAEAINEQQTISGSNSTVTINSNKVTDLIIKSSNNTVNIKSNIGILNLSGSNNNLNISSGVTIEKCNVSGLNNTLLKASNVTLNCSVSGSNNIGF